MGRAQNVCEPVVQSAGNSIDSCMGTVHSDVLLGKLEENALLGIRDVDGLEAPENEWVYGQMSATAGPAIMGTQATVSRTIAYDNGDLMVHRFLSNSRSEVVGEKHRLLVRSALKT